MKWTIPILLFALTFAVVLVGRVEAGLDAQGRGVTGSINIEGLSHDVLHEIQMERGTCYLLKNKLAYPVGTLTMLSCVR